MRLAVIENNIVTNVIVGSESFQSDTVIMLPDDSTVGIGHIYLGNGEFISPEIQ